MEVTLRAPRGSDSSAAVDLIRRYWAAARPGVTWDPTWLRWSSLLTQRSARRGAQVLCAAGRLHGLVTWSLPPPEGYADAAAGRPLAGRVTVLCVEPGDWQQGAFELLLQAACRELARDGCDRAELWLTKEGSPARVPAEALGFAPTGAERALHLRATEGGQLIEVEGELLACPLQPPPLAHEVLRLALPRALLIALCALALVGLYLLGNPYHPACLALLSSPLAAFPATFSSVWARRGRRAPLRLVVASLGVGLPLAAFVLIHLVLHAQGLSLAQGSAVLELLAEPEFYGGVLLCGAALLSAALVGPGVPLDASERWTAFALGHALLLVLLVLLALARGGPGLALGVACCMAPASWAFGLGLGLGFLCADFFASLPGHSAELYLPGA